MTAKRTRRGWGVVYTFPGSNGSWIADDTMRGGLSETRAHARMRAKHLNTHKSAGNKLRYTARRMWATFEAIP